MKPLYETLGFSRWEQDMSSLPWTDPPQAAGPVQARDFAFEETGNPEQYFRDVHQVLVRLRSDLQELRGNLTEYGPVWYDEVQDARLAASLQLIDGMIPPSASAQDEALKGTSERYFCRG
jgi:hypothetical protein